MALNSPNGKAEYVERLFASIAPRYDLLNSLLSFNMHKYWRRFSVRQCRLSPGDKAIDIACGTGDFAIELVCAVGPGGGVTGVDFCRPMLDICARKLNLWNLHNVTLLEADALRLPVPADTFQAATIGFAMRNVEDVETTFAEMARVVKPGGRVVCLELARPKSMPFRWIYNIYFYHLLPIVGGIVNGRRGPYDYLPTSLTRFHSREELSGIMAKVGLADIEVFDLTGGIVAVHVGVKK